MKKFRQFITESVHIDTKVSENGIPLLMYHGGSFSGGEFKGTAWFTTCEADAEYYAEQNGGDVTKAHLIIKSPLYSGYIKEMGIKISDDIINSATKRGELSSLCVEDGIIQFIESNGAVLIAQDIGRDGVIDITEDGSILDAIVFKNEQILIQITDNDE
jgi:hypothetical protein